MMKKLFFALLTSTLFFACGEEKPKAANRPKGEELEILYDMVSNYYPKKDQFLNEFVLQNHSKQELKNNWTIYFHQARTLVKGSIKGPVNVTRINGDFYKIEPSSEYKNLKPETELAFSFANDFWIIKNADFPVGFYIVFKDSLGNEETPEVIETITYAPLVKREQLTRTQDDSIPLTTPESRFENNKAISELTEDKLLPIVPSPVSYKKSTGVFTLSSETKIFYQKGLLNEATYLQSTLKTLLGKEITIQEGLGKGIQLSIGKTEGKTEAYSLNITPTEVTVTGSDNAGAFYGIQSLRALIPVQAYVKNEGSVKIAAATISDSPRFSYRGMHLDVVRNFHTKESVLKLLDLMSFYKLNKFHFHITDDEGWRLEIPGLPELTEVGGKRGHTKDEHDMLMPAYGSGPFADPAKSYGTGHYTKADFIEILKYATARHIEVIPELDFPGHARAAIVSMKARYNKYLKSDPAKAKEYILHDPADKSVYLSVQYYSDNITNVCQESTYKFLDKVVSEISTMYNEAGIKLKMVHTGGDEVPHPTDDKPEEGAWLKSPVCIDFMAKSDKYKKVEDLFYYFVERFNKILSSKGITTGGWEEIGLIKQEVDGNDVIVPNVDFTSYNMVPYVWNTVWGWGVEDRGYQLANFGYKVVLSNVNNLYFDLAVDNDPLENGYYWGGFVNTRKAWDFIPFDITKGVSKNSLGHKLAADYMVDKVGLTAQGKSNILGIQGQLWSETVKGKELMEYMMYPKLIGLAERAWAADPSWTSLDGDQFTKGVDAAWNQFANTLGKKELVRLEYLAADKSVNYRIPVPGAKIENNTLEANCELTGFSIMYTLDKTKGPWIKYSAPVPVQNGTTVYLKTVNVKNRESRIISVSGK